MGVTALKLGPCGGAAQSPLTGLNKTRDYFCPSAPPPARAGWSCGTYLAVGSIGARSPWAPLLLSNMFASKLTSSDFALSTNPEKSVPRAEKTGFLCSHNLLGFFSTAKPQLLKPKSRINSFVFWISLSHHFFFSESLKVDCLNPGPGDNVPRKLPSSLSLACAKGAATSTQQANWVPMSISEFAQITSLP